jgi:hypothetical protein
MKENKEMILEWLKSDKCMLSLGEDSTTFVKIPYGEHAFILFYRATRGEDPEININNLSYCGLYCKLDNSIYEETPALGQFKAGKKKSLGKLRIQCEQQVNSAISDIVEKDRDSYKIRFDAVGKDLEIIQGLIRRAKSADVEAMTMFCENGTPSDVRSKQEYYAGSAILFEYLADKKGLVKKVAKDWVEKHNDIICFKIAAENEVKDKLEELINQPENPIRQRLKLIERIKDSDCDSCAVTVLIEGKEVTKETDAYHFRALDFKRYGSIRLEGNPYEKMMEIKYEDIKKITCVNEVLYEVI